jgi:thiamine monophosphate synthase
LGVRSLHEVLAAVSLPVFALGGIDSGNVSQVIGLPVTGVAVISAIALAADRGRAVEDFRTIARRVRGGEE